MAHGVSPSLHNNPSRRSRIAPLLQPVQAFLSAEYAGSIVLLIATVLALAWANSPWGASYDHFWHQDLTIAVGQIAHSMSLAHWVNDGLMVLFFFLVGLEIKRELILGELSSVRHAALPIAAGVGGMVVPALIYASLNFGRGSAAGWGIPMATDIAFAVGVLAFVGRNVPIGVKVLLLAIAIVDDLGAVLVIAVFYTSSISGLALAIAGGFLAVLVLMNVLRIHQPLPYLVVGVGLWAATLASGVHATIAGVLLAFTIPATRQLDETPYIEYVRKLLQDFERDADNVPDKITPDQSHTIKAMEEASQAVQTPLARIEHGLLGPVSLLIVPLFALANAGVALNAGWGRSLQDPVLWGVLIGLLVGKPVGVIVASWLAVRSGVAVLPLGATRAQIVGVGILCGIGFTMSLFVGNLAFPENADHLSAAKVGILAASLVSGVVGGLLVMFSGSSPGRVSPN